ncbi:MAG: hypothetical protein JXR03_03845 [Cyclobacteriaceae bacterium]
MNLGQKLINVEKKYALTFIGLVITVALGAISIYASFFRQNNPNLEFRIESLTNVLEVNQEIGELQIFYKDNDIIKSDKNLSIIRIIVINNGSSSILQNSYDQEIPFGLYFENAKVLKKPEILDASNGYLEKYFEPEVFGEDSIQFPKLIIDSDEYIVLDILIIHDKEIIPVIHTTGKIAQIDDIELIELYINKDDNVWENVVSGGAMVHFLRFLLYAIVVPLALLFVIVLLWLLFQFTSELIRKRVLRVYRLKNGVTNNPEDDLVLYYYIDEGKKYVKRMEEVFDLIVNDPNKLTVAYNGDCFVPTKNCDDDDIEMFEELSNRGVLTWNEKKNQILINSAFWNRLRDLNSYLKLN